MQPHIADTIVRSARARLAGSGVLGLALYAIYSAVNANGTAIQSLDKRIERIEKRGDDLTEDQQRLAAGATQLGAAIDLVRDMAEKNRDGLQKIEQRSDANRQSYEAAIERSKAQHDRADRVLTRMETVLGSLRCR